MTNYPTSLDTYTNPSASSEVGVDVGGRTHSEFHSDINDAVEALQAKLGIDGSAVQTTHDYKLSEVTSTDKAVGITASQTLSNKTLTAPKFVDGGFIADANGNEMIILDTVASAVNEITLSNAATGANPNVTASGGDSNIGLDITTKGTGTVSIKGNATQAGTVRIYEDADDGSNYTSIKVGTQAGNVDYTLPTAAPVGNGYLLSSLTNGTMSWIAQQTAVTVSSVIPQPDFPFTSVASVNLATNTTANVGKFTLVHGISAAKLSINVGTVNVAGTVKIAVFSEDGQTQHISFTTATISGTGIVTTSFTPVSLSTGTYYIVILPVSTTDIQFTGYAFSTTALNDPAGEPVHSGTITVTASTMPATITPTAITAATSATPIFRLDN